MWYLDMIIKRFSENASNERIAAAAVYPWFTKGGKKKGSNCSHGKKIKSCYYRGWKVDVRGEPLKSDDRARMKIRVCCLVEAKLVVRCI